MSRKYKFHNQDRLYFVTYTVVNWIDLFTRNEYRQIIIDSLKHCCEKKDLDLYAWCMMTNHVHLIISTRGNPMENILRDHKRHTSELLSKTISNNASESRREWMMQQFREAARKNPNNTLHQLWQQNNKPIELYSEEVLYRYLDYIHYNPVKAGFVEHPEDWLYSSAKDYNGKNGLLDIVMIDRAAWG